MTRIEIKAMELDADSVTLVYVRVPDDLRYEGRLFATHTLSVADCKDYEEEIDALRQAALHLLKEALEDFQDSDPVEPSQLDDDDDDDEEEDQ